VPRLVITHFESPVGCRYRRLVVCFVSALCYVCQCHCDSENRCLCSRMRVCQSQILLWVPCLMDFLPGIIPCMGTSIWWCWQTAHCAGNAVQRMRPLPTFFVGVRPWPLLGRRIYAPFWSQRILRVKTCGPLGALVRRPGSHERRLGHKGPVSLMPRCIGAERPRTHIPFYLSIHVSCFVL
jgi:hypothetical protein